MLGTYERLGLHVSASSREVIKAARKKIDRKHRKAPAMRVERKAFYRIMLDHHTAAQQLFDYVATGKLPVETCSRCGEDRGPEAETTHQQWQCECCGSWEDRTNG